MESALKTRRNDNFPEWYQEAVLGAQLAETAPVRGCMVMRPWGYGIWERIQRILDDRLRASGHDNAYFPLLIPMSFLEREAEHVEGFAKECAVVTHHRLEGAGGTLSPAGPLEEPLVIRPTSETIIGASFARWIQSYRDLPLLINQWANVFRWEMRPRILLRTAEFLWQEGHTAHATADEARNEAKFIHEEVYHSLLKEVLAIPAIIGEKPPHERFPGAEVTLTLEGMMQDGKALQLGTSHYLGQAFSKACGIKFLNRHGVEEFAYTTSWGVSTRLIGALVMTHGDDDGIRLPPQVAPQQVVVLPIHAKAEGQDPEVSVAVAKVREMLSASQWSSSPIRVVVDDRDIRGGDKNWQWVRRGIPIRIEIGPRDVAQCVVTVYRRDASPRDRQIVPVANLVTAVHDILNGLQERLYADAKSYLDRRTESSISSPADFAAFFPDDKDEANRLERGGFVIGPWSGSQESLRIMAGLKVSIRCLLPRVPGGSCVVTGEPATTTAVYARAY